MKTGSLSNVKVAIVDRSWLRNGNTAKQNRDYDELAEKSDGDVFVGRDVSKPGRTVRRPYLASRAAI